MQMIFFDTETTGLRPGQICQLSYILIDTTSKPNKIEPKNIFFSVDYMEPSAESIHGFSIEKLEKLSKGKTFRETYKEFYDDFVNADILAGHNVQFDIKFITKEFERCGLRYEPKNVFCTMKYYKDICKFKGRTGECKNPKLCEVAKFLNLSDKMIEQKTLSMYKESGAFHDARFDTTTTYLLVTEGIKKGYIPPFYFSKMS